MLHNSIYSFIHLAEIRNYTLTAQVLHVSQSTISKHIQFLENSLGNKLFTKNENELKLTSLGQDVLPLFRQLAIVESQIFDHSMRITDKTELVLGASHTYIEFFDSLFELEFNEQHPNIKTSLMINGCEQLLPMIIEDKLDFALITAPLTDPNLEAYTFGEFDIYLLCHPEHPLAEQTVSLQDIYNEALSLRESDSCIIKCINMYLESNNSKIQEFSNISINCSNKLIKQRLKANHGIAFLFDIVVEEELKNQDLKRIYLENDIEPAPISLVKAKDKALSNADYTFIEYIANCYEEHSFLEPVGLF